MDNGYLGFQILSNLCRRNFGSALKVNDIAGAFRKSKVQPTVDCWATALQAETVILIYTLSLLIIGFYGL